MDGKQHFRDCCAVLGLDATQLFKLGNQNTVEKGRLKFTPSYTAKKQTQIFAVNYYSAYDIYVAWQTEVGNIKKRYTFSVNKESVMHVPPNCVFPVPKDVGYSGWGQEMVYAFRPDSVKLFLQKYIIPSISEELE